MIITWKIENLTKKIEIVTDVITIITNIITGIRQKSDIMSGMIEYDQWRLKIGKMTKNTEIMSAVNEIITWMKGISDMSGMTTEKRNND